MDRRIGKRLAYLMNHHRVYANEKLKKMNLTYVQAKVLLELAFVASFSQEALGKKLLLDKARISRLVKQLYLKGYVSKETSHADHRSFLITLSSEGEKLIPEIAAILDSSSEYILKGISNQEVEQLINTLDQLCVNVSKEGEYYFE